MEAVEGDQEMFNCSLIVLHCNELSREGVRCQVGLTISTECPTNFGNRIPSHPFASSALAFTLTLIGFEVNPCVFSTLQAGVVLRPYGCLRIYIHTFIMSKFGVLVMGPAGAGKVCASPALRSLSFL